MPDSRRKPMPRVSTPVVVLAFVATLGIGLLIGHFQSHIVGFVAPLIGIKVETGTLDLSSVQKTYQSLSANFDGDLDEQLLVEGASRGLVEAAGDDYTQYFSQEEAEAFNNDLSGNIGGGVGIELGERNDRVTIIRVLDGNPAKEAGLLAGDIIVGVNDETDPDWNIDDIVQRVRGEPGTTVKLTVIRGNDLEEFSVTREVINNPSVYSSVQDGVGILTISRFDGETGSLARQAARSFADQGVEGVVLDLRGNGGGYLTAAQEVASIWLDGELVVSEQSGNVVVDELYSATSPILDGVPTIVLVNAGSASASEIVAGALQDHGAATLLGEITFGKGSVQQLIDLPAGAQLKVTIARWYTPDGHNISEEGLTPDQEVERSSDDVNAGRDPQLDAATAQLRG